MQVDHAPPCFDPTRAEYPIRVLPIDAVIDLLSVSHAPERIAEYRAAMQRGDAFPPIAVVRFGTRYYVADGHKRLSAYRSLTSGPIVVEVWTRRRWLRDQWEQFSRKTRQQVDLARRFSSDADARRAARRLAIDTLEHWRRIARSLRQRSATGSAAVSPLQLFMRLMRECLAFPGRLAGAVVSLVVLSAAQLYLTWLVKQWADGPLVGDGGDPVGLMIAGVAVTAIMVGAVFASRYLLNSVNQRMVQRLRDAALARILALRPAAAQEWRSGELVSRIVNDAGVLSAFVRDVLKRLLGEGLLIVGALTMAFYLDWRLALAVCTVVPVIILLLGRFGQIIRQRGAEAQAEIGGLSALLNEQLSGLSTIKGFESEAFEHARFADQNRRYRRSVMRGEWWASLLVTGVWMITGVGMWAVLWYGTRQVASGQITPGGLFAFFLYVLQTLEPLRRLSEVHALLQRALASAARVYEITDCTAIERGGTAAPHSSRGSIRFEAVHFRYRPDEPVLQGLTLTVQPGEPVALVAASGGGKSTLAKLLVRFADPQSGSILLDGIDIRMLTTGALRRSICVVEQEPFLFSGPLLDNLRYGSWGASRRCVEEAAAMVGLEAVVDGLPRGLDTEMAEAGRNLSVGQKQRIALARAVIRASPVVVLDEATSALDSETEGQIFAQLEPWLRRRATLVIAHRLSTVSRFERVVLLDRGRVAGDGSLPALVGQCPAFVRLFGDQLTLSLLPPAAAAS